MRWKRAVNSASVGHANGALDEHVVRPGAGVDLLLLIPRPPARVDNRSRGRFSCTPTSRPPSGGLQPRDTQRSTFHERDSWRVTIRIPVAPRGVYGLLWSGARLCAPPWAMSVQRIRCVPRPGRRVLRGGVEGLVQAPPPRGWAKASRGSLATKGVK